MYSAWFRSTFQESWNLYKLKSGGPNFWGEPILQNVWIIWSPLPFFNFKRFLDGHSSSLIRFQSILRVLKFPQIKEGGPNFCGQPILQNVWIISSPLLFSNFKSFLERNSLSFIRFQSILHESRRLSSQSWNFLKLKRGDLISWGNQFCRMSELFGPPFCISILKVF